MLPLLKLWYYIIFSCYIWGLHLQFSFYLSYFSQRRLRTKRLLFGWSYLPKLLVLHIKLSLFDVGVHAPPGEQCRATLPRKTNSDLNLTQENNLWGGYFSTTPHNLPLPLTSAPQSSKHINCSARAKFSVSWRKKKTRSKRSLKTPDSLEVKSVMLRVFFLSPLIPLA